MAAAIALALALLATPALAATVTWTGAGLCLPTNWSTNNCWVGGAPTTGDDVVLAQSGGVGPVNYNLNVTLQSLTLNTPTFGGSNYTIANTGGGILGLQSGGFITDNSTSIVGTINTGITLNGPATFTLSAGATGLVFGTAAITGTAPLTLVNNSANDALRLTFASTYTGATIINGTGTVDLDVNGAIPTGSALTVNGSALFNAGSTIGSLAGGGNVLLNGNNTLTVGGDNSSTTFSGVYQDVNGNAALTKTGSGTFTLSGVNTYTGGSTVSGGLVNFSALSNLGSGNVTLNGGGLQWATGTTTDVSPRLNALGAGGATFDTNGNSVTLASALTGAGSLTKSGTGTLTLSGANNYSGGTTVNAGTLSGNTTSLQGAITNNATVTFDQAANGTYAGVMGGTGGLVKSGVGILTLSGANTYSGGTTVNAGTLSGDTASLQGAITNNATVIFDQATNGTYAGIMGGSGGLTKSGAGTLILSGANTYSGGTTINAGTLSGDTASLQGAITNNATVTFNQAINGTYAGVMGGTGGLVKSDAGILTLSGVNTYGGGTTVNAGTLSGDTASLQGAITNNATVTFNQAINGTYAGVMGGTGGLVKSGAGILTLSGANTYSGGTTVNAGTLAGTTTSLQGNIANNAAVTFDQATDGTYVGVLSGTGSVTKAGVGTLTLSGANTYSGTTTVNAGTLAGDTAGLQGNIANNAAVAFDQATAGTYAGVLSGTGSVTKAGAGTLTLSGANTYSGTTTVNAGTLEGTTASLQGNIANNAAVTFDQAVNGTYAGSMSGTGSLTKSGTGTLTLSGINTYSGGTTINQGTLSGDTASLQGAITNNATVTFDQTANGTYAGAISGTGGLTKSGTGKTILSGANTYTGDTNINGGILSVNGSIASNVFVASGGTLGGSGTIGGNVTVASGGIIAPGNSPGILTVNSLTLNSGSITRMEINGLTAGTEYDQIVVNNTATLGGTLDLVFGYTPTANSRFTLIQAGNIVPGFAAIQNNLSSNLGAALQVSTIVGSTTFDILVNQGSFVPFALTHNQRSAASMLDAQFAAWGSTRLISRLDGLSAAQLPAVLGSLSGEQHTHGQSMARRLGTQFNGLLLSRLDAVNGERAHGWNFWLKGLGGFGKLDGDDNAGRADNHSGGFALGADTGLGDHVVLGAAASYARSHVDAVTANLDMDSYQLSGYGKWLRDDNYVKGTLGAGFHQTDSRRTVFEDSASASYGSTTAGTALEAGRNVALLEHTTLTPYAGMQYQHLNRNNFTETGSDLANLKVRETDEDSFRTLLGARLSQIVKTGWGVSIQPSLHAAWVQEHGDRISRMAADFAAAPAAVYRVNGPQLDRSRAAVGAGLVTQFSKTAQLNVAYNAELAKSDNWHTLSATFEYRW